MEQQAVPAKSNLTLSQSGRVVVDQDMKVVKGRWAQGEGEYIYRDSTSIDTPIGRRRSLCARCKGALDPRQGG